LLVSGTMELVFSWFGLLLALLVPLERVTFEWIAVELIILVVLEGLAVVLVVLEGIAVEFVVFEGVVVLLELLEPAEGMLLAGIVELLGNAVALLTKYSKLMEYWVRPFL